jgi:lambda family phage minor tail protein L
MAIPVSELQKIAPSSVIELFELQLVASLHGTADVYRFHAGANMDANGEVVWAGNTYQRFPVEAEGFAYEGNGQLPRPKLRVSNILGTITAILLQVNAFTPGSDLNGAKLTRIRTMARYLDGANFPGGTNPYGTPDPTAEFPREIYYVDRKTSENREVVEFELAAAFDLAGIRAPKRQCISSICQWVYRSAECSYTGTEYFDENDNKVPTLAADVCGKRLSSCKARFGETAELPFGSFPGIGAFTA